MPMNLSQDHDILGSLPKKTRRAIEETVKALESVKERASKEDYAISSDGMSLQSAVEVTERLLAIAKCHDETSGSRIERVAPLWSFIARSLADRDSVLERVYESMARHPERHQSEREAARQEVDRLILSGLTQVLGRLGNELGQC